MQPKDKLKESWNNEKHFEITMCTIFRRVLKLSGQLLQLLKLTNLNKQFGGAGSGIHTVSAFVAR